MNVHFVDLHKQYQSLKEEMDAAISDVIHRSSFIGGPEVKRFEEAFAAYVGVKHCVGCANGTDAIEILLQAMGIGPGHEVIVPAHSWISTAEAVSTVGARPVFVDTLPLRYTIDPTKIEGAITANTKAIIPVHLCGLPAEMDEICAIAKKHQLLVLEDCAQAHGALYKGRKIGTFGDAASFSFYPGKNLGAYGDAGAMLTHHDEIAQKVRMLGNHGQQGKHNHLMEGRNSRLDGLQAAVLKVKLPHLDRWNNLRQKHAAQYRHLLQDLPLSLPDYPAYSEAVYHLYVIQCERRDELAGYLQEKGVFTAIHYPTMLPLLPPYQGRANKKDFPVSVAYQEKILSLPIYPELEEKEIEYVVKYIREWFNK
jgi:dTDP-4-amino-4,6-dideoxygalactose transaminase